MKTSLYTISRMLRKSRDMLRAHPLALALPLVLRFLLRSLIATTFWGNASWGSFSSLWGIWFGGSLQGMSLIWALLQLLISSAIIAYTLLRYSAYLQGHNFSARVVTQRTLQKLPKFFLLSIVQYIIMLAPVYLGFALFSYHLWRGAVLIVAGGVASLAMLIYLIFMKYVYLIEGGICPSIIAGSWKLVKTVGRWKVAHKMLGIRAMMALIGLLYGLFISPLLSAILPGLDLVIYPILAAIISVWTYGAIAETYLTYKEKIPQKGEDRAGVGFWLGIGVLSVLYLVVAWCFLMFISLGTMFLNYGTTNSKWELPHQAFTQEQQVTAQKNLSTISTLLKQKTPVTLILSQDDINAMIAETPGAQEVLQARIQDNLLYINFSFGLSKIPQRQFANKYIYGSLGFKIQPSTQANQAVEILLMTGTINGKALPSKLMDQLKGKNIADGMYQNSDADTQAIVDKIKSIEIKNNKLFIQTKE